MTVSVQASVNAALSATRTATATFTGYTPAAGDIIALFTVSSTVGAVTDVSGWTNAVGSNTVVASDSHSCAVVYHTVTASEESGGTLTYSATNLWNTSQSGGTLAVALRGVDGTVVVDSVNTGFDSGNSATPHVLAGLTGANLDTGSLVLGFVCADGQQTYASAPSGWTFVVKGTTGQTGRALLSLDSATTSGSDVSSANITPAAGDEYCSVTVAFTLGDKNVAPSGATLTLTGSTPTLLTDTVLTPSAASLALTGSTPTISAPVTVTPSGATLTLTGSTPSLAASATVTPSAAVLSLTGSTPSITRPVTVNPSGASVAIAGSVPTVSATNNIALTPIGRVLYLVGGTPGSESAPPPPSRTFTVPTDTRALALRREKRTTLVASQPRITAA